jgi:nucleotide-binding universal stress UspA family protein
MTTPTVRRILVAIDFSESASFALEWARTLARACGAEIVLLHVVDLGATWVPLSGPAVFPAPPTADAVREVEQLARASLDGVASGVPEVAQRLVRTGHPREVIPAAAAEVGADMIVVGSHGRRGISQLFMGSVAEEVVRKAKAPVLLLRAPEHARERG